MATEEPSANGQAEGPPTPEEGESQPPPVTSGQPSDDDNEPDKDKDAKGKDRTFKPGDKGSRNVYNTFFGGVNAASGLFGFGEAGEDGQGAASATGRLGDNVLEAAADCYIAPCEPYAAAESGLLADHVVVIEGDTGIGKRTSAIMLLRQATQAVALVSLAPSSSLEELRKRDYEAGYGYVIFDRTVDRPGSQAGPGDAFDWADSDHGWRAVSERVRESRAYLVVTAGPLKGRAPEAVRHVPWERPAVPDVLSRRLGADADPETIEELTALLPERCAMADLVKIADAVAAGGEPEEAVNGVLDQSGRQEVWLWFACKPTREQVIDVTTLAFVTGRGERAYEAARELLQVALARAWPPPPAKEEEPEQHLPQNRAARISEDGLLRITRGNLSGAPVRTLAFREDNYRRYVLEELGRFESPFWDAVRVWLNDLIRIPGLALDVAAALALLSYTTFDEIDHSYLEPWSRGESGWEGQVAATFVLWFMSMDDELGPVALHTAEWWAGQGSTPQRLTAILAFQGELGICYPTAAAQRLWQLLVQENNLSTLAARAFGELFAALLAAGRKAGHVVQRLRSQLDDPKTTGKHRIRYELTLLAILSVLNARNPRTGQPASMEYIRDNPGEIAMIAEMWAAVLRYRPCRQEALRALLAALNSLELLSGAEAERDARALGDALGAALPQHEHEPLKRDFVGAQERSRRGPARSAALTRILLAALDRASRAL